MTLLERLFLEEVTWLLACFFSITVCIQDTIQQNKWLSSLSLSLSLRQWLFEEHRSSFRVLFPFFLQAYSLVPSNNVDSTTGLFQLLRTFCKLSVLVINSFVLFSLFVRPTALFERKQSFCLAVLMPLCFHAVISGFIAFPFHLHPLSMTPLL